MSEDRFAGKVAVVTGGASGMGAAVARRLSAEGARVVVAGLDGAAAAAFAAELPGEALGVEADVATTDGVDAYSAAALETYGGLDLAVLNAGMGGRMAPLSELEPEEFDHVVAVNLRGVFLGLRAALRAMRERGGAIVVTSSTAGLRGSDLSAYSAAKHGAVALVQSAAAEGAAYGVRVNGIAPDSIETPMTGALVERLGGGPDALRRLAGMTPLGRAEGRMGTGEEVAALVTFLLSAEASWITGTIVPVDGGLLAADAHHLPPPG